MWVLIDNYDSFTHILHHYLLMTGNECTVWKNDEISVSGLAAINPSRLIISPGPQTPLEAGITMDAIRFFHDRIPMLGVCLGHQALGMFFGGSLKHLPAPVHGKTSQVQHNGHPLFAGIPGTFEVMRYHSLTIELPPQGALVPVAASLDDHTLMACVHPTLPLAGLQFHPESIGTPDGKQIIENWAKSYL